MDSEVKARHDAEQAAADEWMGKLAEKLGGSASARAVFGDPVERDGVTVIPVARFRYGFGGGSGRGGGRGRRHNGDGSGDEDQYGSGAGGGVQAGPIGYIELRDGQASFTRIGGPKRLLALIAIPIGILGLAAVVVYTARGRLLGGD
jgi:uncharacterized spore protein YtfJ